MTDVLESLRRLRALVTPKPRLLTDGLPRRHYKAILADPPWAFKARTAVQVGNWISNRHVEKHYDTMTPADIKALPIRELAHPDGCHLFLWITGPNLPLGLEVINAWGFKYSGIGFTWAKLRKAFNPNEMILTRHLEADFHTGLGLTTRKNVEMCLLARRGNARRNSKSVRELILAPRREHSRKPEAVYERIREYCDGPYLELFGRQQRDGWTVRGDEANKFNGS